MPRPFDESRCTPTFFLLSWKLNNFYDLARRGRGAHYLLSLFMYVLPVSLALFACDLPNFVS